MELVELSDLIGAIEAYVAKEYKLELRDLIKFSDITKRAFTNGKRVAKDTKATHSNGKIKVLIKEEAEGYYAYNPSGLVVTSAPYRSALHGKLNDYYGKDHWVSTY